MPWDRRLSTIVRRLAARRPRRSAAIWTRYVESAIRLIRQPALLRCGVSSFVVSEKSQERRNEISERVREEIKRDDKKSSQRQYKESQNVTHDKLQQNYVKLTGAVPASV